MSKTSKKAQETTFTPEMQANLDAFDKRFYELLARHRGKIALFADAKLVEIYHCLADAYTTGVHFFGLGKFMIKEIKESKPINLGWYSATMDIPEETSAPT